MTDIQKLVPAFQDMERKMLITIHGDSMSPTLRDGDKLYIRFAKRRPYTGEIVLFHVNAGYVVHRVVKCYKDGSLATKGDGNLEIDQSSIDAGEIVGYAIAECKSHLMSDIAACLSYLQSKLVVQAYEKNGLLKVPRLKLSSLLCHAYLFIYDHIETFDCLAEETQ